VREVRRAREQERVQPVRVLVHVLRAARVSGQGDVREGSRADHDRVCVVLRTYAIRARRPGM
jgi:hypothetical protein